MKIKIVVGCHPFKIKETLVCVSKQISEASKAYPDMITIDDVEIIVEKRDFD